MEQEAQRLDHILEEAHEGKIHLSEGQIHNIENQAKYLHEHAGHEETHSRMALIIIVSLISFQFVLLYWKKHHYRSYQATTTIGLWLIPFMFALHGRMDQFASIWAIFTILNSWIIYKATRKPLHHMTPKIVYKWFWIIYQISYVIGIIGYVMMFLTFMGFGAPDPEGEDPASSGLITWGLTFLSYGIYFGILGRDFVEFCTESMAATLGYYTKEGFPRKHLRLGVCAICGIHVSNAISTIDAHGHLQPPVLLQPLANGVAGTVEPSIKLNCGHEFHEECIRGWCLIGKKDMCPYCKEKVDLRAFKTNPWDTTQQLYLNLLDALRYMIVWQPVIMGLVQFGFYMTGLK
ncbi:hypothetical protein BCR41DRAFT_346075 [Lobosporangium transversale]|uniref:RING-type domain-containing protein n=1 Tax=Lobosporangium transversale TaxID=64571 RepID=A0A1Y2GZY9_9FUNG|nr:hypothetical protein BCR41DRAFT_346075 [Lobosporangium transversale]ORZ27835.1 hypothetical protein BCR41DRAFT_346075 [Lobosporangium transversale]|eukprot:XP_021885538.1 hypothetical protein BCR41DRAFT_346075 [Lobosporangium transversale]